MDSVKDKARRFADAHRAAGIVVIPNAWDIGSAVVMAEAGFPAIGTTSAGIAFAQGLPDGERISRSRMFEIVSGIAAALPIPVTADLEAGYGPRPEDVASTVRDAIGGGLAGCNIEDTLNRGGKKLYDFEAAVDRIRAGAEVAKSLGIAFVLNARTDAYLMQLGDAKTNFAESVRRANAYLAAGATSAFVPGPTDAETVRRLAHEIDGPLNILGAFAGRPSPLGVADLETLGVKRVSIGGSLAGAVLGFIRRAVAEIRDNGVFAYHQGGMTHAESTALFEKYAPKRP
jgi:2-methylisocitrate lyase-like PEP mutase family enzyme